MPQAPLPNELSVDSQVYGGELVLRWTFSAERYEPQTISELADAYLGELHSLIEHCLRDDAGGLTPSDFPLAKLNQAQLDALPIPAAAIEDVYPLTPMQEGMLLHTLLEPGTGLYYMQDRYRINSELDPQRFAQAWQAVIARHEALRASFCWNVGEDMLQVIHKPGSTPIEYLDWSEIADAEQEPKLQALLKTEREAGFDLLNQAPFHLRLIRVGAARYWFMMSNHHILIDAWCRSLLMNDFFEIYTRPRRRPGSAVDRAAALSRLHRLVATPEPGRSAAVVENQPARFRADHADPERPAVPARTCRRQRRHDRRRPLHPPRCP